MSAGEWHVVVTPDCDVIAMPLTSADLDAAKLLGARTHYMLGEDDAHRYAGKVRALRDRMAAAVVKQDPHPALTPGVPAPTQSVPAPTHGMGGQMSLKHPQDPRIAVSWLGVGEVTVGRGDRAREHYGPFQDLDHAARHATAYREEVQRLLDSAPRRQGPAQGGIYLLGSNWERIQHFPDGVVPRTPTLGPFLSYASAAAFQDALSDAKNLLNPQRTL
ncbi:hypothetical protein [Deinococcus kurensis]|uniref:hypothetical protein n=1 Tax=Deinococcus kurensis TaxID=2662757 RepID=UPI0012D34AF8|nr:hypothetical protein [Deinococcus kurensis]